jgi:hypothetical protein
MKLRSDLPFKYYLEVSMKPELRDNNSILFSIINYMLRVIEIKNKEIDINSFKFSSKSLKYIFGDMMENEQTKNEIVSSIKALIVNEDIIVKKDQFHITEKGLTNFYILK